MKSKICFFLLLSSLLFAQGPSVKIDLTDQVKNQLSILNGGTGASDAVTALNNLGGVPALNPIFSGTITTPLSNGLITSFGGALGSETTVTTAQLPSALAGQTLTLTYTGPDVTPWIFDAGGSSISGEPGLQIILPATGEQKALVAITSSELNGWFSITNNVDAGPGQAGIEMGGGDSNPRDTFLYRSGIGIITTPGFFNTNSGYEINGSPLNFSNLAGSINSGQFPAATPLSQGAVFMAAAATTNILGTAAQSSASSFDASGAAATAQTNAEAFASNAANLTSGTVAPARLPRATASTFGVVEPDNTTITVTLGVLSASVGAIHKQVFTSSGTFTIPSGITTSTTFNWTIVGAGASGCAGNNTDGGGGGGAGGAAKRLVSGYTAGNTITVTVGSGGTGIAGTNGNTGGSSSISSGTQTISTVTASGGGTGTFSQGAGGAGGTTSGGDADSVSGGSGGSGFSSGDSGSTGGGTIFGSGGVGGYVAGGGSGYPGTTYGSGGGGGDRSAAFAGGNGANGIVIVEWVQ